MYFQERSTGEHPGRLAVVFRVVLLWLVIASSMFGQEEITRRKEELESLREEIQRLEGTITEQRKKELATLELLDAYDRKTTLVRTLIGRIRKEESKLQMKIDSTHSEIDRLEEQLHFLRDHYASYVVSVYKAGTVQDMELLLSSRSINQAFVRSEYMRRFSEQRKEDADRISLKKREREDLQAQLQQDLTEQRRLLAEKASEEDRLADLTSDRRDILQQIRKDRRSIQREVDRRVKAAKELEELIATLVEAEILRQKRAEGEVLPQPPVGSGTFALNKGKLRWPVSEGTVVARFGNQTHPTLKTVTQNPGIDVAVKPGAPVTAVAGGRVARIWWLVSYGNLVIIDHGGGFRTIYAHLAEISVAEEQDVAEGDLIATCGETLEGSRLHFEIWKDREKQNPEQWLAPASKSYTGKP
jgi:septal ring factor EnvC (AmiA/AmiB activator)